MTVEVGVVVIDNIVYTVERRLKKINMKFNFRKISAIASSAILVGMTAGVAAAANYPAPFVGGTSADVAVVMGTGEGVSSLDHIQATNIFSDLQSRSTGTTSNTPASVSGGDAASLASGSDLLYLNDDLGENVQTLTKDDLSTVLADGTFSDDSGTDYDYSQTIAIGQNSGHNFGFGNSGNDLDDPALLLNLGTTTANAALNLTVTFDTALNFSASDSEGQEITFFGKTYTISTSTDADTLVLLGGADDALVNVGETVTLTVGDESYDVTLNGLSSATTTVASISVNGETKTFTQGQTKTIGGVDLFAKTVFRTGDDLGHVEVQVGADKLTLETGSPVMVGSDSTDIDGTLVTITPATDSFQNTTKIVFGIVAPDNDEDHVLAGESFMDPIFGTTKIDFAGIYNGPTFTAEQDTGRSKVSLLKGGNRELQVSMTDKYGIEKTSLPFFNGTDLADDAYNKIIVLEGTAMTEDQYFFLNSGNYQHFMQLTKVNLGGSASDDVWMKDLFSGTVYKIDNKNFNGGQTLTINNQVYTVTNTSNTAVTVTSSDYATNKAVWPHLELYSDKDHRVAWVETTTLSETLNSTATDTGKIFELPTGSIQFNVTNATADAWYYSVDSGSWTANASAEGEVAVQIGQVDYIFYISYTDDASGDWMVVNNVSLDNDQTAGTDALVATRALLFVEEEDKSESTADTKNFVLIEVGDDGTYADVNSTPYFSGASAYDTETFDDTDFTGYLTNFGTYLLYDATDTNQRLASFTYNKNQMYADVYVAEESASITAGAGGPAVTFNGVVVTDAEVGTVSGKNLIIVGGSCVNSAAATLVGGTYCGSDWTDNTGAGANQWIIKGYATHTLGNKLALLVAGYEQTDTANAATYLTHQAVDTSKEYLGTSATQATMVVDEA